MDRFWRLGILTALLLFIYAQTADFGFLNYDDDGYVTANAHVLKGLAADSIAWAFSSLSRFYWHPLTWLSLMADVEFFGVTPGAMHLVNVVLHIAAALLLFVFLRNLTGSEGRSFAVAALFAVHPLRIESVAWIAERKDVLSGLLMIATFFAYERYVRQPSRGRYAGVIAVFTAACMAKPMAITVPILLLLLDFWPLKRRAFAEKIPFVAVAAIVAVLTYIGQQQMGALRMLQPSLASRLQNAVWSIGQYLQQTFVPAGFSILYPYPRSFPGIAWITLALAAITGIAVWQRERRPWILTGWVWFLIGLAPTLGLIQAGVQARADRFTYIPQIGILIIVVWLAAEFLPQRFHQPAAALSILALTMVSYAQVSAWRSNETIFAQALANTSDNWLAEYKYGLALIEKKDTAGAERHLKRAASLDPSDAHSRFQLGKLAAAAQRHAESAELFTETVRLKPDYADAHYSRGSMLAALNRPDEAVQAFDRARELGLEPEWEYRAHVSAGVLLARAGRMPEAEKHFQSAVALQPGSAEARRFLAQAQDQMRQSR